MITDARVLREGRVPQDLNHREGQIQALTAALDPITDGYPGEDTLITGESGMGKTTTAKYVLQELERKTLDVRWGYVDCYRDSTESAVLHELIRDARLGADLREEGTSTRQFLNRLRDLDGQFVAVLDEVDVIADTQTIHTLQRLENVTLVLITLDEDDFFVHLDDRARSRLRGMENVHLHPYTHTELIDILQSRVDAGLAAGSVTTDVLAEIADIAAGDARYAITMLRKAAYAVDRDGRAQLTIDDVHDVPDVAREDIHQRRIDNLSSDKRMLYEIVKEYGTIGVADLRREYLERRADPVASSTRRKYIRALERGYELIQSTGSGKGKTLHVRTDI